MAHNQTDQAAFTADGNDRHQAFDIPDEHGYCGDDPSLHTVGRTGPAQRLRPAGTLVALDGDNPPLAAGNH